MNYFQGSILVAAFPPIINWTLSKDYNTATMRCSLRTAGLHRWQELFYGLLLKPPWHLGPRQNLLWWIPHMSSVLFWPSSFPKSSTTDVRCVASRLVGFCTCTHIMSVFKLKSLPPLASLLFPWYARETLSGNRCTMIVFSMKLFLWKIRVIDLRGLHTSRWSICPVYTKTTRR